MAQVNDFISTFGDCDGMYLEMNQKIKNEQCALVIPLNEKENVEFIFSNNGEYIRTKISEIK